MKRTSNKKPWKEEMVKRWDMLVQQYQTACNTPSFKLWMRVFFGLFKIAFSVILKKIIEHIFKDF